MNPDHLQSIAQRDQLWASLRMLRPFIDELGAGQFNGTAQERQIIQLLARIVVAELEFREENTRDARRPRPNQRTKSEDYDVVSSLFFLWTAHASLIYRPRLGRLDVGGRRLFQSRLKGKPSCVAIHC